MYELCTVYNRNKKFEEASETRGWGYREENCYWSDSFRSRNVNCTFLLFSIFTNLKLWMFKSIKVCLWLNYPKTTAFKEIWYKEVIVDYWNMINLKIYINANASLNKTYIMRLKNLSISLLKRANVGSWSWIASYRGRQHNLKVHHTQQ